MTDLFADQYLPPTHYRSGGETDYIPPLPLAGGDGDAPIAASVSADPRKWWAWLSGMNSMIALGFAMALVALIIAVLVWYGCANLKKDFKCLTCRKLPQIISNSEKATKLINSRVCGTLGLAYLAPGWGYVGTTGGLTTTGMLLSAGTQPPATITVNALPSGTSVVQAVYKGLLKALAVEINAPITAGSATFTVTVNGIATALSGVISNTSSAPNAVFTVDADADQIPFAEGDTIGVTISQTGVATTTPTFTSAAQVLVQYTPVAVAASPCAASS